MNERAPLITVKRLAYVSTAAILLLAAAVGWLAYRVENLSADLFMANSNLSAYKLQQERQQTNSTVDWSTVVKSGKGGFQVRLPGGWGPIVNDIEDDYLSLATNLQPTLSNLGKVKVEAVKGHTKDGRGIFSIALLAKDEALLPQGAAEPFNVGKAEDTIQGTKYTHIYAKDSTVGIGTLRLAGDRDYEYILPAPDSKELHVQYSVYGSDPRNLVETVDEIVRTIVLGRPASANL